MKNQASCQFCSKPDDSIQVVCESRCLLCSKCQLVPAIRKLLIDHTLFSDDPSIQGSQTEKGAIEPKIFDDAPYRPSTTTGNNIQGGGVSSTVALALKGHCPICSAAMSLSMLLMIQSYREAFKVLNEDQMMGVRLEEHTQLIPTFLKRFRLTYDNSNENKLQLATAMNNIVDLDAEIEAFLSNPRATQISQAGAPVMTNLTNKPAKSGKAIAPVEKEAVPAAAKVNITTALEFIIDCYHAQWQSIVKNGNDSMLSIMMKQSNRKKFSQKTNDYKTKGLIDFLLSGYGYEMPELILFCHLIGLQPKFTPKISAAWSHISATALVAICYYDACVKSEELYNEQTTSAAGMNELKTRLLKCFHMISLTNNNANNPAINQLNSNNSKVMSVKKALKIIELLQTIRQPYWIMAPLMATCVEYESRLAWTEESLSKLIATIFFVALSENSLAKKGVNLFNAQETPNASTTNAAASGPRDSTSSLAPNRPTVLAETSITTESNPVATPNPAPTPTRSRSTSAAPNAIANQQKSLKFHGRKSSSASFLSKSTTTSMSSDSEYTSGIPNPAYKPISSRTDLLRRLHPLADSLWKDCSEKFASLSEVAARRRNSFLQMFPNQHQSLQSHLHLPMRRLSKLDSRKGSGIGGSAGNKWSVLFEYWGELDEHVLHRKEKFYFPITLAEALAMEEVNQLMLPINDFLFALVLCWEREYHCVQEYLEKSKITKLRRPAFTANCVHLIQKHQANNGNSQITSADVSKPFLPPMTAGEKQAITKLLFFYRNQETKEFLGIDWDEVEDKHLRAFYPFSIPRSLLHKSRIELNLLCQHLIKVIQEQLLKDEEDALLAQNERANILLNYTAHTKAKHLLLTTTQMIGREALSSYGAALEEEDDEESNDLQKMADDSFSTIETIATPPVLKLMNEAEKKGERNGILVDERHGLYSTQLLEPTTNPAISLEIVNQQYIPKYDAATIQRAIQQHKLLQSSSSASAFSPQSFMPRHLELSSSLPLLPKHQEYEVHKGAMTSGGFQRGNLSPQKGSFPSSSSLPTVNVKNINKLPTSSKENITFVDLVDQDHKAMQSSHVFPRPVDPLLDHHHNNQTHNRLRKQQGSPHIMDAIAAFSPGHPHGSSHPNEEETPQSPNSLIQEMLSDTTYYENIEKSRKTRLLSTRSRILERYQQQRKDGNDMNRLVTTEVRTTFELAKTTGDNKDLKTEVMETNKYAKKGEGNEEEFLNQDKDKITPALSWKSRIIPYLQLRHSLNAQGDMTVNLSNSLISESSVRYLSMKDGKCSLQAFEVMLSTYCKPWQMEYMKVLDVSNNPRVGSKGAELLGGALRGKCRLIHVNLNGCKIGDAGLRHVLQGMIDGGGEGELLRLDLQSNDITIATPGFALLSQFHELKFLDVSKNLFTLENKGRNGNESHRSQWDTFYTAIYALVHNKLEYLSLAYNKIQDEGFSKIVNEIILTKDSIYYYLPLKVLDVAYCFLTNKSKYLIELLIVNSMQRENDGNVYKKAYEYTERHLYTHDYLELAESIQAQFQTPHLSGTGKKVRHKHASHRKTVLASLPRHQSSKYNDQKILKVFIKPEMLPIVANINRSRNNGGNSRKLDEERKQRRSSFVENTLNILNANTRSSFRGSNDSTDSNMRPLTRESILKGTPFFASLKENNNSETNPITDSSPVRKSTMISSQSSAFFQSPPSSSQGGRRGKKTRNKSRHNNISSSFKKRYNLQDSFMSHLNNIVHENENIILMLNNLENQTNVDNNYYHEFQLSSYYLLTSFQMLLLHGNILTQNVWDEICDFLQKSTMKVFYHPKTYQKRPKQQTLSQAIAKFTPGIFNESDEDSLEGKEEDDEEEGEGGVGMTEYGNGIEDFQCYDLQTYSIDLHETELATL